MLRRHQQIAVSRRGIDAGQHRLSIVEDLIVQAHTNAGQVLVALEDAGFLRDELKHLVDGTDTDRYAQQVTQELNDAAIRAVTNQRQANDHLA
jgi:hypothetical protein